jgi:hypothetical protein
LNLPKAYDSWQVQICFSYWIEISQSNTLETGLRRSCQFFSLLNKFLMIYLFEKLATQPPILKASQSHFCRF